MMCQLEFSPTKATSRLTMDERCRVLYRGGGQKETATQLSEGSSTSPVLDLRRREKAVETREINEVG